MAITRRMILALLVAIVLLIGNSTASAFKLKIFDDYTNLNFHLGVSSDWVLGSDLENDTLVWGGFQFTKGEISKNDKWKAELSLELSYLYFKNSEDALLMGIRLRGIRDLIKLPKINGQVQVIAGLGLATLTNRNNHNSLGNSGLYGLIEGGIRLSFPESSWSIDAYIDHISDSLQKSDDGDSGGNIVALRINKSFEKEWQSIKKFFGQIF